MIRQKRFFAVASAAAVLAAAGGALMLVPGATRRVDAATIYSNLRQAVTDGFTLTITGYQAEGVRVNGSFDVRFARPVAVRDVLMPRDVAAARPAAGEGENPADDLRQMFGPVTDQLSQVAAQFNVELAPMEGMPAMKMQFELASQAQGSWIYTRIEGLEAMLAGLQVPLPGGGALAPSTGIMLDLGPGLLHNNQMIRDLLSAAPGDDEELDDLLMLPPGVEQDGAAGAGGGGGAPVDLQKHLSPGGPASPPLQQAILSLVSGHAGPAQLRDLQGLMDPAKVHSSVADLGGGEFVLTATPRDEANRTDLGTIMVGYTENVGIRYLEIRDAGASGPSGGGSIRLTFVSGPIAAERMDINRLSGPGKAERMDANAVRELMGLVR